MRGSPAPGWPYAVLTISNARMALGRPTSTRGRAGRPDLALPARPADLELPLPADDPDLHRGGATAS